MGETDFHTAWRNADGTINTNGFMQLVSGSAFTGIGADFSNYQATQSPATLPNGDTTVVTTTTTTNTTTTITTTDAEPDVTTTPTSSELEPVTTTTITTTDAEPDVTTTTTSSSDIVTVVAEVKEVTDDAIVVETSDGKTFEIPKSDLDGDVAEGQSVKLSYDYLTGNYMSNSAELVANTTQGSSETPSEPATTTTTANSDAEPDDTTITTTAQQSGDTSNTLGDINLDGEVQANDMLLLKKHLLGINQLEGQAYTNADINGDGEVAANDLLWLKKVVLGMWDNFDSVTKS
jgi:hypothetical protein